MPKLTLPSCVRPSAPKAEAPSLSHEEGLVHADKALTELAAGEISIEEALKAMDVMVEAHRSARASRR